MTWLSSGSHRVYLGGSCYYELRYARLAYRNSNDPDYRFSSFGVRLVRRAS